MVKKALVSAVDNLSIRSSGAWINRKHFYLRRYMDIFTKAMKRKWSLTYIDLFAGPGRCLIESTTRETEGSPLISLNYDFSKYIFIEKNQRDLEALKRRCRKSPKFSHIEFIEGDCNEVINSVRPTGLSLAFIDPTGIDVHFKTIKTTANRKVDLLMNIQFGMDIKRNFKYYLKAKDGSPLDHFLGGSIDWSSLKTPDDAIELYKNRIHGLGYSTVKYKDIVVHNIQRRVPMYFLFFASKNPTGTNFWNKITKKDESGQLEMF